MSSQGYGHAFVDATRSRRGRARLRARERKLAHRGPRGECALWKRRGMAGVQFYKYSAYGNTFVVLDELHGSTLSDAQKSAFAPIATDEHGGVGADNLLVIQPYGIALMADIQQTRGYWTGGAPTLE